jgi:hypothetical protein
MDLESQLALTPDDLGVPGLTGADHWAIGDGNHRFAAALYRGDERIVADITGEERRIVELLGGEALEE